MSTKWDHGWAVSEGYDQTHVWPIKDLQNHDLTPQCWCGPHEDEGIWVHHALDGRDNETA